MPSGLLGPLQDVFLALSLRPAGFCPYHTFPIVFFSSIAPFSRSRGPLFRFDRSATHFVPFFLPLPPFSALPESVATLISISNPKVQPQVTY